MQRNIDLPLDSWSDEELLAQYRQAASDRHARGPEVPDIGELEAEIERRGLVLPERGEAALHPESDEVLPAAESQTGEPGISPPITPG